MEMLMSWGSRQWAAAAAAALVVALAIGLPSDVIPNPVFGRPIEVTWWSYPVLVITALLAGLLIGTYVRATDSDVVDDVDRPMRAGSAGGMLSFFAVGCPTCNKLVVVALGSSGALDWFAPAQPILAGLSIALLIWALRVRLSNPTSCPIPS
jgi:hypothetical protein